MNRLAGLLTGGALSVTLAACTNDILIVGPQSETRQVELPSRAPRLSGTENAAQREHRQLLQAFGGEYKAPAAQTLLNDLAEKLRVVSDKPSDRYKITILNSGLVNAFALPSGQLYVTRGLLVLANDTSEVASVLAHEIAHVSANHAMERAELESRSVLVSRVRAEVLNNPGAAQLVRDQAQVAIASFSRQQELEADQIGLQTLTRAGLDPYGAHRFLIALGRNTEIQEHTSDSRTKASGVEFGATHPSTSDRVAKALLGARQYGEKGLLEADRTRWLNAINGMIYGEDSNEGFIRGRTFLHPRLGISFTAPDGFMLENTAQAVLGMTAAAGEALRLDSAKIPMEKSLESFLIENKIEGLTLSEVQTLSVNGLPAATGLARGTEWTFRIYAVRIGTQVYRVIMAARTFTQEVDDRFKLAFESFRKLSPDEQGRVRPLRVAIVVAKRSDTAEEFSQRMGGMDRALDRFLALNALEPGAELVPGRTYKVIVD